MSQEISDAIKEQEFREAAMVIIKSHHHHGDGTAVELTPIDESTGSDIERCIIEDEQEWKLKQQTESTAKNLDESNKNENKKQPQPELLNEVSVETKKQKTVVAGCNCGQIFSSTFSNDKNPAQADVKIKNYDPSGSATSTYSVSGSEQQNYSASGSGSEDYAKQG